MRRARRSLLRAVTSSPRPGRSSPPSCPPALSAADRPTYRSWTPRRDRACRGRAATGRRLEPEAGRRAPECRPVPPRSRPTWVCPDRGRIAVCAGSRTGRAPTSRWPEQRAPSATPHGPGPSPENPPLRPAASPSRQGSTCPQSSNRPTTAPACEDHAQTASTGLILGMHRPHLDAPTMRRAEQ